MSIWRCKVGTLHDIDLPKGADWPMRKAIGQAFADVTGQDADFCFSGWRAELSECELAVVEDRDPVYEVVAEESPDMLRTSRADALQRALKAETTLTAECERARVAEFAKECLTELVDELRERNARLVEFVTLMQQRAGEGYDAWDMDENMRAGKCLKALAGRYPGYWPDMDALRTALEGK